MLSKLIVLHDDESKSLRVQWQQNGNITDESGPIPFENFLKPEDRSHLRWYLEEYLRFPIGIYPDQARRIEEQMREWGGAMFERLFGKTSPAREIYTEIRKEWREYGLEIHYTSVEVRNFPWELLYDTDSKVFLVHQFASFARYQGRKTPKKQRVRSAEERLNVLLIIARPLGDQDVPYRTVARPVMSLLREPGVGERIHVEVLRPPTFANFKTALSRRRKDGSAFFDVVHFDGHGGFGIKPEQLVPGNPHHFNALVPHGELVFETNEGKEDARTSASLKEVLGQHDVPLVLLNACRSGMEALEDHKAQALLAALSQAGQGATIEELRQQIENQQKEEISSVTGMLIDAGAQGVVGMGYIVYARAAALFMGDFYKKLLAGSTAAEAVSAGRLALVGNPRRPTRFGDMNLEDWQVPVYHEVAPVSLFQADVVTDWQQRFATLQSGTAPTPARRSDAALPPAPHFGFLGRDRELLAIERALLRVDKDGITRVAGVTLVGLGGAGKTSLAAGAARWLLDTHAACVEKGVFFHAFLPHDAEGNAVHPGLHRLVASIGKQVIHPSFPDLPDAAHRQLVAEYLRTNRCLLILDNAEGMRGLGEEPALLDEAERREWKAFLHEACPPVGLTRLLLTSRRAEDWLDLNLEAVDVGGLDEEAADELAASVARASMGTLQFEKKLKDEKWERDFDALLKVLGGHPLAIQIILRHLEHRDPAAVQSAFEQGAAWIDQKLESGTSDRERLLAACINYGFGTLSPRAQTLLPFLAYWREWADAEYLAIISNEEDAPARLQGATQEDWTQVLCEAESTGLVTRIGDSEMFRLHPLLSWFLRVRLFDAADAPQLEAAFRRFGAGLALGIFQAFQQGGGAEQAIGLFGMHRANLLHALSLARPVRALEEIGALFLCLYNLLDHSGQRAQAAQLRDELAAEWKPQGQVDPETREGQFWLDLQLKRANELQEQRDFAGADSVYQDIVAASGGNAAAAFHQLGIVAEKRRDFDKAQEWYQKSLEIELRLKNEHGAAQTYHQLGIVAQERRDFDQAQEWYQKSLEIELRLKDEYGASTTYHNLGIVAHEHRDFDKAEEWYQKSLEIRLRLKNEHGAAQTYHQLGIVAEERRDFDKAEEWYQKSLEIKLRLKNEHAAALTYGQLANMALTQGKGPETVSYFVKALRSFQILNSPHYAQITLDNLRIAHQQGIITRALLTETWQREMGAPVPPEIANYICVESENDGDLTTPELPPELRQLFTQLLAVGMGIDEIISTFEQAQGESFPPEVKDFLRQEIEKIRVEETNI